MSIIDEMREKANDLQGVGEYWLAEHLEGWADRLAASAALRPAPTDAQVEALARVLRAEHNEWCGDTRRQEPMTDALARAAFAHIGAVPERPTDSKLWESLTDTFDAMTCDDGQYIEIGEDEMNKLQFALAPYLRECQILAHATARLWAGETNVLGE